MGSSIGDMWETHAMRGQRGNTIPCFLQVGELKSYNPADNTVDVNLPHVDGTTIADTQTYRMPLMVGMTGPSYGTQDGPDASGAPLQVLVASIAPDGDDYIAVGFLYTANQAPPGAPATEFWRVDKRGSSVKLTVDGKTAGDGAGGAKVAGAGYASVTAPLVELGSQGLNAANNAVIRKSDLDSALSAAFSALQTQLTTWAASHLQSGSGASGPSLTANTSTGSTTVKAAN